MSDPVLLDRRLLDESFPLPDHPDDADKNERGLALFIAGSRELSGAALLAGLGALRAGAGKLRIATARSIALGIGVAIPEARVISFADSDDGCVEADAVEGLVAHCRNMDSLTIGPGMQPGEALEALIENVLDTRAEFPLVLDAAALGVLRPLASNVRGWPGGAILLPHTGEMARLLDRSHEEVNGDREEAARTAAETFGAAVVSKGAPSYVVAPDGRAFRFPGGGVGLATSGSGDTLAGIVGGLAARGAEPLTALLWAVYLHGEAGRLLTERHGRVGFLAREILDLVPSLMNDQP